MAGQVDEDRKYAIRETLNNISKQLEEQYLLVASLKAYKEALLNEYTGLCNKNKK